MSVLRIDAVTLLRRDAVDVTAEGFHLYDALFARTGNQLYDNGRGGTIIENRPDGEVFSGPSLASYELRPLGDLHPPTNLDAETARFWARGATSAGRRHSDGRHVAGRLSVWDSALIGKFETAAREGRDIELSAGYTLDIDPTPGVTHDGQRYDAIQRNIRINHVAVVPAGRAGTARVVTDAVELAKAWALDEANAYADLAKRNSRPVYVDMGRWARHDAADLRTQTKDTPKMKITIDSKEYVLDVPAKATPQQLADAMAKHLTPDPAKAKVAFDAAVAAGVKEALAETPPKKKDAAPDLAAKVAELEVQAAANADRADALSIARGVKGLGYTAQTPLEMKHDVILAVLGKDALDDAKADPGAVGYLFRKAAHDHEAKSRVDHGGDLVREINEARGKRDDKKDPTQDQRKAVVDRAGMTRAERKAHDKKAS